jgi:hypothetical protein
VSFHRTFLFPFVVTVTTAALSILLMQIIAGSFHTIESARKAVRTVTRQVEAQRVLSSRTDQAKGASPSVYRIFPKIP